MGIGPGRAVIFLDSWIWLEYVFDGEKADDAEAAIERANTPDEGGLLAPKVLTEVSYRVCVIDNEKTAAKTVNAIRDYENIRTVPVGAEIGVSAAELRAKYYRSGEQELSYADAIHLATAVAADDCDALYSGDPDFRGIEEIDTVVL